MWKSSRTKSSSVLLSPEQSGTEPTTPAFKPITRPTATLIDQATIAKGMVVKGEITGSESLFIDGIVEGSVNLPENHITVGRNGQVSADITARDIVVMGKVSGNINALNRLDIRAEASVTGSVAAVRLRIEDGATLSGTIEVRKAEEKPAAAIVRSKQAMPHPKAFLVRPPETGRARMHPVAQSA
jgi:cytoskeletal protein CcmA (bactofilin family)